MTTTIHTGDCLAILPTLPADSVDLVVTSPPYDALRTYNGNNEQWSEKSWQAVMRECHRLLRPGGTMVWIVDDQHINGGESLTHMRQALWWTDEIGGLCHDTMIWNKGCFQSVGNLAVRYAQVHEYMLVLTKGRPTVFNPLKDRPNKVRGKISGTIRNPDGTMKAMSTIGNQHTEYGQRFSVWYQPPCKDRSVKHPARFPLDLATDHILSWSNPGDLVLDPFMGSGTTGVACAMTGRKFTGVEIDPEYVKIAEARIGGCINDP